MRRFTLLCLVGYILAASETLPLAPDLQNVMEWPPGATGPMSSNNGLNTTNSTGPAESGGHNETAHWNGTMQAVENNYGFPPTDEQKTTAPKKDVVPSTTKKTAPPVWHPFGGEDDFPPKPADEDETKKTWHPFGGEDDFPPKSADGDATKGTQT